jgi:hypothetical protein
MGNPGVAAQAAVQVFPPAIQVTMVAIAGAESAWDPQAAGDPCAANPGVPCCAGATSFGLWQIHTVHAAYLRQVTGSNDPCVWRAWLSDPVHNAQAAYAVYRSQGFAAWTTYTSGAYRAYLAAAQQAVAQARAQRGSGNGGVGVVPPVLLWLVTLGAAAWVWQQWHGEGGI